MKTSEIILLSSILLFCAFVIFNLVKKSKVENNSPSNGGGGNVEVPPVDAIEPPQDELGKSEIL